MEQLHQRGAGVHLAEREIRREGEESVWPFAGLVGEPLVVVGFPRSGTSLICGLLNLHGVWVGQTEAPRNSNTKGSYENGRIKKTVIDRCGRLMMKGRMAERCPGLRAEISKIMVEEGYESGPWLMKSQAVYLPALSEYNPIFVKILRPSEKILESVRASNMFHESDDEIVDAIKLSFWEMNKLKGFTIRPQHFIDGDFRALETILDHIGLDFDKKASEAFVDKEMWHF